MKIHIDFDNLIITLEGNVGLYEFIDRIKTMLPFGEWKDYTLSFQEPQNKDADIFDAHLYTNDCSVQPPFTLEYTTFDHTYTSNK